MMMKSALMGVGALILVVAMPRAASAAEDTASFRSRLAAIEAETPDSGWLIAWKIPADTSSRRTAIRNHLKAASISASDTLVLALERRILRNDRIRGFAQREVIILKSLANGEARYGLNGDAEAAELKSARDLVRFENIDRGVVTSELLRLYPEKPAPPAAAAAPSATR